LHEIRRHLLKAIYIDYTLIPKLGQATIKHYAKMPTYYASSADLAVELEVTKFQLQQISDEHANAKTNVAKQKRTNFARMFMHAADKSKHSKKTSELEAKLQVHDDHMHKLHTKTYEMVVNLLTKLESKEQLHLVESIFKQFNMDDTKKFLISYLNGHKDFDEGERIEFIFKLTSSFMEDTLLEFVKKIISSLGGRSKSSVLFDVITKKLSPAVRQAIIVDILLADTNDRTHIFSKFFKLVEKKNTLNFTTFVMDNLFDTQEERVRVCGQILKYCVGIGTDENHLKHFAHDVVEEISSKRGNSRELNNFQNALLQELVKRCGTKLFRQLSDGKRQQIKRRKSERQERKKKEEAKQKAIEETERIAKKDETVSKKVPVKDEESNISESSKEVTKDDSTTKKNENANNLVVATTQEKKKLENLSNKAELIEQQVAKITVSDSDSDDEDFLQSTITVETRTIETQTDPVPDILQPLGQLEKTLSGSDSVSSKKDNTDRIVKDMRPFASVLQFEKKEGKPLTYNKCLQLIYTTYANKIVADKTADRNKLGRESIGNFITRSMKNEFGLDKRVSLMLAGLIKSINKFKSRSRRIEQFSELCGLALDQEYSSKTCDIYLNILKTAFPKFNKATLVKQTEGDCKITHATAKRALHRVFPKKKSVKFSVGRLKLREDIFDELKQTIKRIAKPKVDFDVMVECCLEASIRQFSINVEILKDMFEHYKEDDHAHLHRENFDELMKICAEGITDDELTVIWDETHQYKTSGEETLNPEIFSHICSKHGIAPPSEWRPPAHIECDKPTQQADVENGAVRKKSSFGVLSAGFKLKSLSRKMKERLHIPLISRMCQTGNVMEVERLLEEEADVNEKDHRGTTPLMHAAWWGHLNVVTLLIQYRCDINQRNGRWNTALHFAYEEQHHDIAKALVDAGAASMKNKIGIVPEDFLKKLDDDVDNEDEENEDEENEEAENEEAENEEADTIEDKGEEKH
jgi:hypothetical protein